MELRIKCDAKVNLEGLINIVNVMCEINDYNVDNNSLSGSVNVKGNYIKDDLHTTYDFKENVPFTVVFKNSIEKIDKIEVEDFSFNEIVNNGLECKFNIYISYEDSEKIIETLEVEKSEEEPLEEIEITTDEDEKIKDDINKKYDELLEEILESREDNFLEENEEEVFNDEEAFVSETSSDEETEENSEVIEEVKENNFNIKNSVSDVRSYFNNVSETYESYHVYYPKQEKELEEICNKENISIDRIYKDKANKDFKDKKRIIIK